MVEYRKYQTKDHFSFCLISNDEWKNTIWAIAKSLDNSNSDIELCWLATVDHHIVGLIYGFKLPNQTLLPEFLYVKPEYRKQGIGTCLLKKLEEESQCTCSQIFYNRELHNYYMNQGYSSGEKLEVAIKYL